MVKRYPIFLEAAEWTILEYWKNVFEQCSIGKFPKNMSISKNVIYVNKGTKCLKWEMPNNPQELFILCKSIFEDYLSLKDGDEKEKDIDEFKEYQEENKKANFDKEITKIKDVRKKEHKLRIIDEFVLRKGKELGMKLPQKQKLKNAILTGMALKMLKDIDFEDSKITDIRGIDIKRSKKGYIIKLNP
jgi:hypothetical protein